MTVAEYKKGVSVDDFKLDGDQIKILWYSPTDKESKLLTIDARQLDHFCLERYPEIREVYMIRLEDEDFGIEYVFDYMNYYTDEVDADTIKEFMSYYTTKNN